MKARQPLGTLYKWFSHVLFRKIHYLSMIASGLLKERKRGLRAMPWMVPPCKLAWLMAVTKSQRPCLGNYEMTFRHEGSLLPTVNLRGTGSMNKKSN